MTELELLIEIQNLRIKLGLEQRLMVLPKNSSPTASGTMGRCVVCDLEYEACDTIRRCARTVAVTKRNKHTGEYETKYHVVGYRVCYTCCPKTPDWVLERYNQNIDDWPTRWKRYSDTGVFGNKCVNPEQPSRIEELEQFYEDDEMAFLDTKLKVVQAKLEEQDGC